MKTLTTPTEAVEMGWTLEEDGLDFYALMSLALWQASILGCKGYLCVEEGKTTIFQMVTLYQLPFPVV